MFLHQHLFPSHDRCDVGTLININGTNADAGTYSVNKFKGRVAGDADSGSLAAQYEDALPLREYIIYPFGTTVASASFHYLSNEGSFASAGARAAAVTSSTDIREVFFVSGSTNDTLSRVGGGTYGQCYIRCCKRIWGFSSTCRPIIKNNSFYGFLLFIRIHRCYSSNN